MAQQHSNDDWVLEVLKTIGLWFWFVVVAAWYLSMSLTKMFLIYLLNPLLGGALDRENGDTWVLALSTLIWEMVALLVFVYGLVPELQGASFAEFRQALWVMAGAGLAWGLSIGFWIVLTWWSSQEVESALHFTDVSGVSADFYQPAPLLTSRSGQPQLSGQELERRMGRVQDRPQK